MLRVYLAAEVLRTQVMSDGYDDVKEERNRTECSQKREMTNEKEKRQE